MRNKFIVVCILCAIGWAVICRADAASWPAVGSVQRTFQVPDVQKMNVSLLIRSKAGAPLYRLRCAHPGYGNDYSGDFECRLDTVENGDVKVEGTLLIEDARQLKAWPSRGRFFAADLVGRCATIPEFGATRDFSLRDMMLTLQVLDPVVDAAREGRGGLGDPELKALKLKVTVQPDPSAYRSIAAIVPFPKQPLPQCGINPGAWVVGAFGALGHSSKDISYFGDPATFTAGELPTPVDWKSVPFSKPDEWNRDMQASVTPSHCTAHFNTDATFRGMLVARRFRLQNGGSHTKSKTFTLDGTVLKLDHPINICRQVAPNLATANASAMAQSFRAQGARAPTTFLRAVRRSANRQKGTFIAHVTALEVDEINLLQLNAYNQKFIGHRVEIRGRVSGWRNPQLVPYNLAYGMVVDRICLLQKGKLTACSSDKRAL